MNNKGNSACVKIRNNSPEIIKFPRKAINITVCKSQPIGHPYGTENLTASTGPSSQHCPYAWSVMASPLKFLLSKAILYHFLNSKWILSGFSHVCFCDWWLVATLLMEEELELHSWGTFQTEAFCDSTQLVNSIVSLSFHPCFVIMEPGHRSFALLSTLCSVFLQVSIASFPDVTDIQGYRLCCLGNYFGADFLCICCTPLWRFLQHFFFSLRVEYPSKLFQIIVPRRYKYLVINY